MSGPIQLEFIPHRLVSGGHLQTMAGVYWPSFAKLHHSRQHRVPVSDGDQIVLHENVPESWTNQGPVALLLHGLAGCHQSGYMVRTAVRLVKQGIRTFRMDNRGSGMTVGLARLPGHAGRWKDAAAALRKIAEICPQSSVTMVGFSMGGNITLRTLAEASLWMASIAPERFLSQESPFGHVNRGIAISPPVDLSQCCRALRQGFRRVYDRYLVGLLNRTWRKMGGPPPLSVPRSIWEFDDLVTAPVCGYQNAEAYYHDASSHGHLKHIRLPARILAAHDDPMVPIPAILSAERSTDVQLYVTESGGHLGYLTRRNVVPDRRWMDELVERWVLESNWC